MFRVKNDLCPQYIKNLFECNNSSYNLRVKEFMLPRLNTTSYDKHSLKYLGPLLWSKLQPWSKHLGTLEEIRHKNALC